MTESSNIARPYARAVFELAQERSDLAEWGGYLDLLAMIAADAGVIALVNNPRVSTEQLVNFFLEMIWVVKGKKSEGKVPPNIYKFFTDKESKNAREFVFGKSIDQITNLVKLLVSNGRIGILPEIVRAYAALRAEAENTVAAEIITAAEIDARQRKQFTTALQAKLGRTVKLEFAVDRELVGGAVVRAGDWVIDGSVRAQLEQLVGALRA